MSFKKRLAILGAIVACLAAVPAAALADMNSDHISMYVTSGSRYCDAYADYVSTGAKIETFGAGYYEFRFTILSSSGSNLYYSPMRYYHFSGTEWYTVPSWNEILPIPPYASVRAWLFKYGSDGLYHTVAYETHACLTP